MTTQDKDERAIADRCLPHLSTAPVGVLTLRALIGGEHDSSAIYRALKKDERVVDVPLPSGLSAFRLRGLRGSDLL